MPSLSDTGRPAFYAIPPSRRLYYTGSGVPARANRW